MKSVYEIKIFHNIFSAHNRHYLHNDMSIVYVCTAVYLLRCNWTDLTYVSNLACLGTHSFNRDYFIIAVHMEGHNLNYCRASLIQSSINTTSF
jgi:hypothetical protein